MAERPRPPFAERLFVMVDVETSGPVIGRDSLLELGAVAGSRARGVVDRFSALIRPVSGRAATQSQRTWAAARERGEDPAIALSRFEAWARPHLASGARFVARPAAFDWPWIVHAAWIHLGHNPFGFKALCASSWLEARGRRFEIALPHVAVQDAELQLGWFLAHA